MLMKSNDNISGMKQKFEKCIVEKAIHIRQRGPGSMH